MTASMTVPRQMKGPFVEMASGPGRVRLDAAAQSHAGLVRENNEDSYVVCRLGRFIERVESNVPEDDLPSHFERTGQLMIVADGMGGHAAGEVASRRALTTTMQLILASPRWAMRLDEPESREREIRGLIARGKAYLDAVHERLIQHAKDDPSLAGMGTTITGAYSLGRDLFVLHVGDSKAYLLRGEHLIKITRDHTVAQHYADAGMISQEEVHGHKMNHVLTQAVGGPHDRLEGEMHHMELETGDRLLLCSDGLTDMAQEEDIKDALLAHPASADACQALVDLALAGGGKDNVTVIVAGYEIG